MSKYADIELLAKLRNDWINHSPLKQKYAY